MRTKVNSHPEALPGTYALMLSSAKSGRISVGKLGDLTIEPGFYIYVGSALGPGGVGARVAHHLRPCTRPHWHIDYLRAHVIVSRVHYCLDTRHREHLWARRVGKMAGASIPLRRFGATDCDCDSHLYFFRELPSLRQLAEALQNLSVAKCYNFA